jgi:hemerythrin
MPPTKFINWNDEISVGINEIDEQHKKLIDTINEAYKILPKKKDSKSIEDILNRLIDYAKVHFTTEEKYFDKYNYPDKEVHKKEHNDFVFQLLHFVSDFEKGNTDIDTKLLIFIKDWLNEHLLTSDQKYALFFKKNNIHVYK